MNRFLSEQVQAWIVQQVAKVRQTKRAGEQRGGQVEVENIASPEVYIEMILLKVQSSFSRAIFQLSPYETSASVLQ